MMQNDEWLDVKQVAAMIGFRNYMSVWKETRIREGFPRPVKLGERRTRWRKSEIDSWVSQRVKESAKKSASRVTTETRSGQKRT